MKILKAIYEHRFLTRALILPLFGVTASEEDTNLDRRLRKLAAGGYVRRLPRENRRSEFVYALTGAGAEILTKHQLPLPFADWPEKNRDVKTLFIEHTLMVARWYVAVLAGAKALSSLTIEHYERESRPRGQYALLRNWRGLDGHLRKVNPDAFLILAGADVHPNAHFLEADRSTMDHNRMAEKFEDYAAMYREKRHLEFFGVPSFRVCVITKTEERASNLLNLLLDGTDIRPDERRLFWFTTEETYGDCPSNVFATVWRSADDPYALRALVGSPLQRRLPSEKAKSPSVLEGSSGHPQGATAD
ncbi:MAG: replication-relaxation family protein [Deltaproteobacteria bacterium]|nr:replication-relaxation family protein [Deltaproteobacteria bacterium]MBI3388701.1 replication-relaxation family protein [Deltaproteobacteria bacterium]